MKLKNSGSISDSEQLNLFDDEEEEEEEVTTRITELKPLPPSLAIKNFTSPFTKHSENMPNVTIFSISPPTPNHDKIYYDDRYNESSFDPKLARSSLPKILISIGGMLLTGFFLNSILVITLCDCDCLLNSHLFF